MGLFLCSPGLLAGLGVGARPCLNYRYISLSSISGVLGMGFREMCRLFCCDCEVFSCVVNGIFIEADFALGGSLA